MSALWFFPAILLLTVSHASFALADDAGSQIETVVVTARKVPENVQSVPVTVNVLSQSKLQDEGVNALSGISAKVPNVVWTDNGGSGFENHISMRGVYSNASSQGFDPGVAIYLDGVYIGNTFGFNSDLLDIDRIEVLKGPQGTLFGRNAAVGAISIHTKRPSFDQPYVELDARIGNYGLYEERGVANYPLSDDLALKVSAIANDRGGYQRNVVTEKHNLNDSHYHGGRVQLLWSPTNNLDILTTLDYFKANDHEDVYSCVAPAGGRFVCPNTSFAELTKDNAADNDTTTHRSSWGGTVNLDWRFGGGFSLTSISAYRGLRLNENQDQDFTAIDIIRTGYHVPRDNQFSEELRVSTPQDARLRGTVGAYYYNEGRATTIPLILTASAIAGVRPLFGLSIVPVPANFLQQTASILKTSSWALFGQGQFDITPTLTLEGGLRYTADNRKFSYEQKENSILSLIPLPVVGAAYLVPFSPGNASASFNRLTPEASLSWKPAKEILAYVRYADGFKAGGFQAATNSPAYNPLIPFKPEVSSQYEIGFKTEWFSNRLIFNGAYFHTNYDDTQVQLIDPTTLQKIVGNFGSARTHGFEFEADAVLAEGLEISGNLGLQSSKFVSGPFTGRTFQYVPRKTAALTATYTDTVWSNWTGSVAATMTYRSAMNLNTSAPGAADYFRSAGETQLNARIGIQQENGPWGAYLWGNNLTNVRRVTYFIPTNPNSPDAYHLSIPRTFGVEVQAHF